MHAAPCEDVDVGSVGEDVGGEHIMLEDEEEEISPAVVMCRDGVEDDGHQGSDVLDTGGLRVEIGHDGGFIHGGVVEGGVRVGVGGGRRIGPSASNLSLTSQIRGGTMLLLQGVKRHADMLLGISSGLGGGIGKGLALLLLLGSGIRGGVNRTGGRRAGGGDGSGGGHGCRSDRS
jgi:hypothetical protein